MVLSDQEKTAKLGLDIDYAEARSTCAVTRGSGGRNQRHWRLVQHKKRLKAWTWSQDPLCSLLNDQIFIAPAMHHDLPHLPGEHRSSCGGCEGGLVGQWNDDNPMKLVRSLLWGDKIQTVTPKDMCALE